MCGYRPYVAHFAPSASWLALLTDVQNYKERFTTCHVHLKFGCNNQKLLRFDIHLSSITGRIHLQVILIQLQSFIEKSQWCKRINENFNIQYQIQYCSDLKKKRFHTADQSRLWQWSENFNNRNVWKCFVACCSQQGTFLVVDWSFQVMFFSSNTSVFMQWNSRNYASISVFPLWQDKKSYLSLRLKMDGIFKACCRKI